MSYKARRANLSDVVPFAWEPAASQTVQQQVSRPANPKPAGTDVQVQADAVERDAFARGFAQGEKAGAEAAATRGEGMLRGLAQSVEELAELRSELLRRTERQTVQLVLAIAERVVQREITIDRSLLIGMARAALDRLGEYGTATIRV